LWNSFTAEDATEHKSVEVQQVGGVPCVCHDVPFRGTVEVNLTYCDVGRTRKEKDVPV